MKKLLRLAERSIIPLDGGGEDQLSNKDSLAAVRNSAQTGARIQFALASAFISQEVVCCIWGF